jgi:putative tricarboxylic transport membrane protein
MVVDAIFEALAFIATWETMRFLLFGIVVGLTVGIIPGMGGTVGLAILIPFVVGLEPASGIAMLVGMMAVTHTSDTFPSVLLGVPGTAGSQATILDGYALARKGRAAEALGAAFLASMLGGLLAAVIFLGSIVVLRPILLLMASPEVFFLTVFGLAIVALVVQGSVLTGLLSGLFGMLLGLVGFAPTAPVTRFTFGALYLTDGLAIALIAMGLFGIPEMVDMIIGRREKRVPVTLTGAYRQQLSGFRAVLRNPRLVVQSSVAGAIVGAVPGLGGSVVDWIAYGLGKRTVKDNTFGTGDIRGVIAPEAANNAKDGGSFMPSLLLGVPGSGGMALVITGFAILGYNVGPNMATVNLHVTIAVVWLLAIANVFAATSMSALAVPISRITSVPPALLAPAIILIMFAAAYQNLYSPMDMFALLILGLVGWVMKIVGWPRAPAIIGFVLTIPAERGFWLSSNIYGVSMLARPGVIIIALLTVVTVFFGKRTTSGSLLEPVKVKS